MKFVFVVGVGVGGVGVFLTHARGACSLNAYER